MLVTLSVCCYLCLAYSTVHYCIVMCVQQLNKVSHEVTFIKLALLSKK